MRPSNKQRSRNKPGNNGHNNNNQRQRMGNIINRVFESAGPEGKVRGTPQQIIDKYQALARDAQVSGDRVAAESFLQHAEHYSRLLGEAQRQQMENRPFNQPDREDGSRGVDAAEQPQRQPHHPAPPVASGLTTFDPDDGFDGPVETPEGRRQPAEELAPPQPAAPVAVAGPNGGDHLMDAAEPEAEDAPQPSKRSRPRRRPRQDAGENPAQPD